MIGKRIEDKFKDKFKPKPKPKPPSYTPEQLKRMRGINLAESGAVEFIDVNKWRVNNHHVTKIGKDLFECDCEDFRFRSFTAEITDNMIERQPDLKEFKDCKHIIGVKFLIDNGANKRV